MFTTLSNKLYVYWLNLFSSYTLEEELKEALERATRDLLVAQLEKVKADQDVKLKQAVLTELVKQLENIQSVKV